MMLLRLQLLLLGSLASTRSAQAAYTICQGETHIESGSCNSPTGACKKGTGYTNVFKKPTLAACEAACDAALPKGNCAGVTWHDAHAGGWATVCVLETADAWAGYSSKMGHHVSACNGLAPCKCNSPSPAPGPPPTPTTDVAGCIVKQAALTYSQKALTPPRHADRIATALDLSGCPEVGAAPSAADVTAFTTAASSSSSRGGASFFVDAAKGSDSAAGTSTTAAFKTLHRAQVASRAATGGATVHLLPGATHYLVDTLTLTPADSHVSWVGATADPTDTDTAAAGRDGVVVSGATSFTATCAGKWQKAGAKGAFSCQLPAGTQFDTLVLNGLRQMKARFPNGDPLAIKDGYDKGCKSVAWWNISGVQQYPTNLHMLSKNGTKISQGSVFPPGSNHTVIIADRTAPREGETTGGNPSYYNTRFNETYNHPFWATTSPSAIKLSPQLSSRSASWKAAAGAVVRMLHPAGWGGWAFEVESLAAGTLTFIKGGNQEARGNKGCGQMYIEGIEEELDSVSPHPLPSPPVRPRPALASARLGYRTRA